MDCVIVLLLSKIFALDPDVTCLELLILIADDMLLVLVDCVFVYRFEF